MNWLEGILSTVLVCVMGLVVFLALRRALEDWKR